MPARIGAELVPKKVESKSGVTFFKVPQSDAGRRLDNLLLGVAKVPRSLIYAWIRRGEVRLNKKRARPSKRVAAEDLIRLPPRREADRQRPSKSSWKSEWLEKCILYEDHSLLCIDKPAGLSSHSGTGNDFGAIELLQSLRPGDQRLNLVHRLDRQTSGCLVVAKGAQVQKRLQASWQKGEVKKSYLALVAGSWDRSICHIRLPIEKAAASKSGKAKTLQRLKAARAAPLGRGPAKMQAKAGQSQGEAHSEVEVLAIKNGFSLLEVKPHSGRPHQIRIHLAASGHFIVGDEIYGKKLSEKGEFENFNRHFLHAAKISFSHPQNDSMLSLKAPLPQPLQRLMQSLEFNYPKKLAG